MLESSKNNWFHENTCQHDVLFSTALRRRSSQS